MAQLHKFKIPKAKLLGLPKRELSIILGGGKILNELNLTTKYMQQSINTINAAPDDPTRTANLTMIAFFLRILAGHVFEANIFFKNVVRIKELKNTSQLLDTAFHQDVKTLNKYFGKKNIIDEMRNQFSFHTDPALLLKSFDSTSDGFTYEALLGKFAGHHVFFGSEMIVIEGVQHLKPDTEWETAIQELFVETTGIALLMGKIFQRIVGSIFTEHLGLTMNDGELVEAADGPSVDDVVLPFFCLPPIRKKKQ